MNYVFIYRTTVPRTDMKEGRLHTCPHQNNSASQNMNQNDPTEVQATVNPDYTRDTSNRRLVIDISVKLAGGYNHYKTIFQPTVGSILEYSRIPQDQATTLF